MPWPKRREAEASSGAPRETRSSARRVIFMVRRLISVCQKRRDGAGVYPRDELELQEKSGVKNLFARRAGRAMFGAVATRLRVFDRGSILCARRLRGRVRASAADQVKIEVRRSRLRARGGRSGISGDTTSRITRTQRMGRSCCTNSALSRDPVYIRVHNLLTTGDGEAAMKWGSTNVYTEDANSKAVYSWKIVDRIFDTFHETGVRPLVQLGFMPEALSTHPQPYQHTFRKGRFLRDGLIRQRTMQNGRNWCFSSRSICANAMATMK